MKIYKRFSFWLTIVAIGVCLFNLLGYDGKGILLFLTSPPFWIIQMQWFIENIMHPSDISMGVKYALTILFWFSIGFLLDKFLLSRLLR